MHMREHRRPCSVVPIHGANQVMKYEVMAEQDPWGVVMLAFEVGQDNMDDDLADGVRMAAMIIAAAALANGGMDLNAIERQFFERDWGVKLTYDFNTDEIGLDIEWAEHPITSIRRVK
jgi:hypothetical protein